MRTTLALVVLSLGAATAHASQGQQLKRVKGGAAPAASAFGYWEYLPQDYDDAAPATFPVLIFFHGSGESGDGSDTALDNITNGSNGPPTNISYGRHMPFIVISPQHDQNNGFCTGSDEINNIIAHVTANYRVDTNRIYLTGLSCGAIGVWSFLGNTSVNGKIAAALPISGNGGGPFSNSKRVAAPIWSFHGVADGSVDSCSDNTNAIAINHLTPAQVPAMRATYYPGGHGGWQQVYVNQKSGCNIYDWLLSSNKAQTRTARAVTVNGGTTGEPSVVLSGKCSATTPAPLAAEPHYAAGSCVRVDASDPPSGKVFDHWDTAGVNIAIPATPFAEFVMPDHDVTLTPIYRDQAQAYVDTTAPTILLTVPHAPGALLVTSEPTLNFEGTAIDDVQPTEVTWTNSAGGSGTAYIPGGAFVPAVQSWRTSIDIHAGINTITFTARDAAGHTGTLVYTVSPPATPPPPVATISSLTLIDADDGQALDASLATGDTVDLAALPSLHLNVRAVTAHCDRVIFDVDGAPAAFTDTASPFDAFASAWTPTLGSHTIVAHPSAGGIQGTALSVTFAVVDSTPPPPPPPPTSPATTDPTPSATAADSPPASTTAPATAAATARAEAQGITNAPTITRTRAFCGGTDATVLACLSLLAVRWRRRR